MERTKKPPLRNVEERNHLVEDNLRLVHHVCRKLANVIRSKRLDYDEAVSLGNLALIRAAEQWDAEKGIKFSTYAVRAIWNEIIRRNQKQADWEQSQIEMPTTEEGAQLEPEVIDHVQDFMAEEKLRAAMQRLPRRQRDVILARQDGFTFTQIAQVLGCSKQNCQALYHAAVERLRRSVARATGQRMSEIQHQVEQQSPRGHRSHRRYNPKPEQPLGSQSQRKHNGVIKWYIKVRMDGPKYKRWQPLARWLWEQAHGPVPEGMRVCHVNGDQQDDRLENLVLMSPGEVIREACRQAGEEKVRKWMSKCHRRAGRSNTERAALRRLREIIPGRWYPVDLARRVIINKPVRRQHLVWKPDPVDHATCRVGVILGWPDLSPVQSVILAAMAEAGEPLLAEEVITRASAILADYRCPNSRRVPIPVRQVYILASNLPEGWVSVLPRQYRHGPKMYAIGQAALQARQQPHPHISVLGRDLLSLERWLGFKRVAE